MTDNLINDAKIQKLQKECKIELGLCGRTLHIDLCYPRSEDDRPNTIEVDLMDVRAADSIRISYDFDRDGWAIQQASRFSWEPGEESDPGWAEVAFVKAWARAIPGPGDDGYEWKNPSTPLPATTATP